MSKWTRFGNKQPRAGVPVWVLNCRKGSKPWLAKKRLSYSGPVPLWHTLLERFLDCHPDDMWAPVVPPELPKKKR